jgi:ABC-2 type transport system permease protein
VTATEQRPLPGPFVASVAYAARACVPPKRWALLALPALAAVLFGVLVELGNSSGVPAEIQAGDDLEFLLGALLGFVLPFACLIVGDAVLGAERRSGLLTLTWLSPASFATIVGGRFVAAWAVANVALIPAMVVAVAIIGQLEAAGALVLSVVAGSAAYLALFMAIGVLTRRGMLWSLGFVMVGEQTVVPVISSLAQLSPQQLAQSVYAGLGPLGEVVEREGVPSGWGAVLRLAAITLVGLVVTERALRRVTILSGAD